MNNLQKQVLSYIDKYGETKDFDIFLSNMVFDFYHKENEEIADCFKDNAIDFIRLFERITDHLFMLEDKEIEEKTAYLFNREAMDDLKQWEKTVDFLRENKDNPPDECTGMLLFLYLLGMVSNNDYEL